MTKTTIENLTAINALMGEAMVEAIHKIIGNDKLSMSTLIRMRKKDKITLSFSEKKSVRKIAVESGLHRSTVYRNLKK